MSVSENNGLKLSKIKSKVEELTKVLNDIKQTVNEKIKTDALVVAYLDNAVLIGKYNGNDFTFYDNSLFQDKYIQKIRIFNKNEELLIWRSDNEFKGRYRQDYEGNEIDVVDAEQVLFGTDKEDKGNGFTRLFEKRGTEIILPFAGLDVKDKTKGKRVFIQTRNYIDRSALQASYIDCRFMGFTDKNGAYLK